LYPVPEKYPLVDSNGYPVYQDTDAQVCLIYVMNRNLTLVAL